MCELRIRRWPINLLIILVVFYALFIGPLSIVPPQRSFQCIVVSKPTGTWGWFDNGAVIWNKQISGQRINVAIIVPIPIPARLNETNFIAVAYPPETVASTLRVGDIVNVRGIILSTTANNLTVHFIHASDIVKIGNISLTDPDFNSIIQAIQEEEKIQNSIWASFGGISSGDPGDSGGDEGGEGDGGGDGGD